MTQREEQIKYEAVIAAENQPEPTDYAISARADHFNGFVEGFAEGAAWADANPALGMYKEPAGQVITLKEPIDWMQFRIQAAIAIFPSICGYIYSADCGRSGVAKEAVQLADALIEELKRR